MGRAKRLVTDEGTLFCSICQRWVDIRDYRCREVIPGITASYDVWYERNGRLFGRPDGYCRRCASKKAQGPEAVMKWQEECGVDLRRHKDRWAAEQDYLDAKALREWTPPEISDQEAKAESERLLRLYGPRPDDI